MMCLCLTRLDKLELGSQLAGRDDTEIQSDIYIQAGILV